MKYLIVTISILFSTWTMASSKSDKAKGLNVDITKSTFSWKGTKVTGQHVGTLKLKSAALKGKSGEISSGTIVLDINSLNVTDLEGEWKQKFEGHMKSPDFFNTAKWPTAKLDIKKVSNGKIVGELTIKDKKNKVEIPFKKKGNTYTGTLKFDRTKYGMIYGSGDFFKNLGDKMIHNDVTLDFNVVLK